MSVVNTKLALLAICALMLETQSLKHILKGYQQNTEQLYFTNNVPTNIQSIQTNNGNLRGDDVNLPQTQASDNYQQGQQIQQQIQTQGNPSVSQTNQPAKQYPILNHNQNKFNGNQYFTQNHNGNYEFQQSVEITPPYDSSQDYNTKQSSQLQSQVEGLTADDKIPSITTAVPLTRRNVTQQDMRLASLTISHIGIFMLRGAEGNQTNAVVSPLSVVNMLALLQAGATGDTQREISQALQLAPELSSSIFRLMNTNFAKRANQHNLLRSANSIFAADVFNLNTHFKNIAIEDFGSELSRINFQNADAAAQRINSWSASKTNNKIDKLVSPDSIDVNTQLILANAVYFKGLWETMFRVEATTNKEFRLSNGRKKLVPFMSLRSGFRCGLDKTVNSLVVVLPFQAKEYSLVLLLPLPNANVRDLLASLTGDKLLEYQNIRLQDVLLEIPKFTVRADTDLQPIFNKMGISKMFTGGAELNNIGLYRTSPPQVSSAVHSAMLSVDERGATAAAATVVAAVALSYDNPSIVFTANRPFLAVLWDNQLGMPLFMTHIDDPVS